MKFFTFTFLVGLFVVGNLIKAAEYTPLMKAVEKENLGEVRWLVEEEGVDPNEVTPTQYSVSGLSALHLAAALRNYSIFKFLVEHGGDWQLKNDVGDVPLDYAPDAATKAQLRQIAAEVTTNNRHERNPDQIKRVVDAIKSKNQNTFVEKLLNAKPELLKKGEKEFMAAASAEPVNFPLLRFFISKNIPLTPSFALLIGAVKADEFAVVKNIVDQQPALLQQKDGKVLPIEYAGNKLALVQYLKEKGSPVTGQLLYYAYGAGAIDVVNWLTQVAGLRASKVLTAEQFLTVLTKAANMSQQGCWRDGENRNAILESLKSDETINVYFTHDPATGSAPTVFGDGGLSYPFACWQPVGVPQLIAVFPIEFIPSKQLEITKAAPFFSLPFDQFGSGDQGRSYGKDGRPYRREQAATLHFFGGMLGGKKTIAIGVGNKIDITHAIKDLKPSAPKQLHETLFGKITTITPEKEIRIDLSDQPLKS